MSLEIPEKPARIDITFLERATNKEVRQILEMIDLCAISQTIIDGVHNVMMQPKADHSLSGSAKLLLQKLADKGNEVSFIGSPEDSQQ
jgi:hypothetical protein